MRVIPKWLKDQAAAQRQIRLNQPRISSEEAQRQVDRVMRLSASIYPDKKEGQTFRSGPSPCGEKCSQNSHRLKFSKKKP